MQLAWRARVAVREKNNALTANEETRETLPGYELKEIQKDPEYYSNFSHLV